MDTETDSIVRSRYCTWTLVALSLIFFLGMVFGWLLAEHWWQRTHQGAICRWPPQRELSYFLLALVWSHSFGALGMAVAAYCVVPKLHLLYRQPAIGVTNTITQ